MVFSGYRGGRHCFLLLEGGDETLSASLLIFIKHPMLCRGEVHLPWLLLTSTHVLMAQGESNCLPSPHSCSSRAPLKWLAAEMHTDVCFSFSFAALLPNQQSFSKLISRTGSPWVPALTSHQNVKLVNSKLLTEKEGKTPLLTFDEHWSAEMLN